MGAVYRASHVRVPRLFAIKLLAPEIASNAEVMARFQREAMITSGLGHPNILEVFDFNETAEGAPYIVMEFLDGEDLQRRLQREKRLDLERAAAIVQQIASAIHAAHEKGIIHRDLKPQNIFLCRTSDRDDLVKVVDFGISKIEHSKTNLTRAHSLLGTPHYMAPEQAEERAHEVDARTDVYALGTILHELLAGQPPFAADSLPALLYMIAKEEPPLLHALQPAIPAAVSRVVARALSKRPEERQQSMSALSAELAEALGYGPSAGPGSGRLAAISSQPTSKSLVGGRVGNYVVEKLLGEGGMGAVYLAVHPEIGRQVAIKVLSADTLSSQMAARFLSEARAVARVNHANVIDIFDFGRLADGCPYYVMEKLGGRELREVISEQRKFTPAEALPYVQQICGALQAAHAAGIVHRDLKPENIFVLDQQPLALKVLDFGIAKLLSTPQSAAMTSTGMVMGTPLFIAPEQAAGQPDKICTQTDLYSLGVIIYAMLAGRLPFNSSSAALLLAMHIKDAPPPLREQDPSIPEAVAELVERCLRKEPAARPASAAEVAALYAAALQAPPQQEAALSPTLKPRAGLADLPSTDDSATAPGSSSQSLQRAQTTLGGATGQQVVAAPRSGARMRTGLIAVGAAAVVALVLVLALSGRGPVDRPLPKQPAAKGSARAVAQDTAAAARGPDAGRSAGPSARPAAGDGGAIGRDAVSAARRRVWLATRPAGAKVTWEGELLGTTPLRGASITTASSSLVISKPGYQRLKLAIKAGTEKLRFGSLVLEPRAASTPSEKVPRAAAKKPSKRTAPVGEGTIRPKWMDGR